MVSAWPRVVQFEDFACYRLKGVEKILMTTPETIVDDYAPEIWSDY